MRIAHNKLDLKGKRFERLLVISFNGIKSYPSKGKNGNKTMWECKCDCGKTIIAYGSSLMRGQKSCGCLNVEVLNERSKTHGKSKTKTYKTWRAMLGRCLNRNYLGFDIYGGRGIKVCERWLKFENFLKDMGERPDKKTLDRIDFNGNYEPSNCRWATIIEQANNTRANRRLTLNGITKNLHEWAKDLNIDQASLRERLDKWPLEKALTQPKKQIKENYGNAKSM